MSRVAVGTELELAIHGLTEDLLGKGTYEGIEIRVPGAAPGAAVRVVIEHTSQHERVAWAGVLRVLRRSDNFRAPECPHAAPILGMCGGCPGMHLTTGTQRQAKIKSTQARLAPLGLETLELRTPGRSVGYRNRTNYEAIRHSDDTVGLGSRAPRSNTLADMDGCLIARRPIPTLARSCEELATDHAWPVWPDADGLRYVSIRVNMDDEALVELVVGDSGAPWVSDACQAVAGLPGVVGVLTSTNRAAGNSIRVEPPTLVAGRATIVEKMGPLDLELTVDAFAQLNSRVAGEAYTTAAEWSQAAGDVVDLYCGVGGLGLAVAAGEEPRTLRGVEVHAGATGLAVKNADRAGVTGTFETASLDDPPPDLLAGAATVLMNPPRRGLSPAVRALLATAVAEELIYMSCSPKTFTRDAVELAAAGWTIEQIVAWDMLPNTTHVELLARFVRNA